MKKAGEKAFCTYPVAEWQADFRPLSYGYHSRALANPINLREPWQYPYAGFESYIKLVACLHYWYRDTLWEEIKKHVEAVVTGYRIETALHKDKRREVYLSTYRWVVSSMGDKGAADYASKMRRDWTSRNPYPTEDKVRQSYEQLVQCYPFLGDRGSPHLNPLYQSYLDLVVDGENS
tara:strand:+ start:26896 stop:27426 length:531 start_codon:yes stop_codon:yes gene_type:complete